MGARHAKYKSHQPYKEAIEKFDVKELHHLKKTFKLLCKLSGGKKCKTISKRTFREHFLDESTCREHFQLPPNLAEHIFAAFDWRGEEKIDFEEFIVGMAMCCKGNSEEKMEFIFHVMAATTLSEDAHVTKEELLEMLQTTIAAVDKLLGMNDPAAVEEEKVAIQRLVDDAFAHFSKEEQGKLNYEEFKQWAEGNSTVMAFFEILLHRGYEHKYTPAVYPTLPDAPPPPPKCLHNGNPATSGLIDMDTFVAIRDELPKNLQHCNFEALYTATQHGYSLKTFEHHVSNKGAFVIIVKDSEGHKFGAVSTVPLRVDAGHGAYYGNSDCFVFKVTPELQIYRATSTNNQFIVSTPQSIAFGGPKHALWLDGEIDQGCSKESETYLNDSLASAEDFRCVELEAWGIVVDATQASHPAALTKSSNSLRHSANPSPAAAKKPAPPPPKSTSDPQVTELQKSKTKLEEELARLKKELQREKLKTSQLKSKIDESEGSEEEDSDIYTLAD